MTGDECRAAGKKQWCVNGHDTYVCGRKGPRGTRCLECHRAYTASEAGREAKRRYNATAKGREAKRRYVQSDKGRARVRRASRRYQATAKGRARSQKYAESPKGRANTEKHMGYGGVRTRKLRAARIAEREGAPRLTGAALLSALLDGDTRRTA